MTNTLLLSLPVIPMALAALSYFFGKKETKAGFAVLISGALICLGCSLALLQAAAGGRPAAAGIPLFGGLGLTFYADGFRALYLSIASFMWLLTALFSPEYFGHGHKQPRYCFFSLMTLGATLGVFASNDLYTAFVFFEVMSFTSYPWVAHEENPAAMRAAATYLAIAVTGGMAMLMGLFLLKPLLGTLDFDGMLRAVQAMEDRRPLLAPAVLVAIGFGAKAGMFPLHVWLPKAHPVAPAPASALLSGVLTKVGVFGVLVAATRLMPQDAFFGNLLLALGVVTMFGGALLALLSVDLKRTLACSSMSQIGFILVGAAMQQLLGGHGALAAEGTVLHMANHSLIKLALFMAAGAVYMNAHTLDLNRLRGFGRGKPFLHAVFLTGAASISGIPFFSGYVSKTLLHESIVEYVEHLHGLHQSALWYTAAEWVFLLTGGMTFAYMLKLYICLFWQKKNDAAQADSPRGYLKPLSRSALGLAALALLAFGLRPQLTMTPTAEFALPFLHAHAPEHAVDYFSAANLAGAAKSLIIGLALYLTAVRLTLMKRDEQGARLYVDRKPGWLDMENGLYRPLVSALCRAGTLLVALPADRLPAALFAGLQWAGTLIARALAGAMDGLAALLGRTVFSPPRPRRKAPVGNRFTYLAGRAANALSALKNALLLKKPQPGKYTYFFAALWQQAAGTVAKVTQSLSFSLMMFAIGFLVTLVYLMTR